MALGGNTHRMSKWRLVGQTRELLNMTNGCERWIIGLWELNMKHFDYWSVVYPNFSAWLLKFFFSQLKYKMIKRKHSPLISSWKHSETCFVYCYSANQWSTAGNEQLQMQIPNKGLEGMLKGPPKDIITSLTWLHIKKEMRKKYYWIIQANKNTLEAWEKQEFVSMARFFFFDSNLKIDIRALSSDFGDFSLNISYSLSKMHPPPPYRIITSFFSHLMKLELKFCDYQATLYLFYYQPL